MRSNPRFRSHVIAAVAQNGQWVGRIEGYQAALRKVHDDERHHAIEWRICVRQVWLTGRAWTVAQALEAAPKAAVLRRAALVEKKRAVETRRANRTSK